MHVTVGLSRLKQSFERNEFMFNLFVITTKIRNLHFIIKQLLPSDSFITKTEFYFKKSFLFFLFKTVQTRQCQPCV